MSEPRFSVWDVDFVDLLTDVIAQEEQIQRHQ